MRDSIAGIQFQEIKWVLRAVWHNLPSNGKMDTQTTDIERGEIEKEKKKQGAGELLLQSIQICIMFNG